MAGDSSTPLSQKLGIRPGTIVTLAGEAPKGFEDETLGPLPEGATVARGVRGHPDVLLFFATRRQALEAKLEALGRAIFPDAILWVAWPKRASGVTTDVTEDVAREIALPRGLVDTKVCAIDDTWSGLRLVWRKELRRGDPRR